ncbi:MAG: DNA gyrase subunit A [Eubacteriales bacterium]|jgi:DNA gyrase subunit A|nr:DNA gyrase subunit A [Eubacteriales bacterium]
MNYIEQPITHTLEQNYMPYAMSVIISRAIPEIDGLKPAHRKLLYTMYKMGLLTGGRTKSANVVGQTMKLNPHGDMAIYETLVRLTKGNEALLHPLIDSKGNFGKQYSRDMAFAAARYTEVKLDSICQEIFGDIDKDTVDFVDNYDGTMKEPLLLPARFPNILVNPNQGIAVGMASNLCSFNLKEVCDTAIAYLKNKNHDILKTLLAPDFSTGGELLYDEKEMREIYKTGRGSFKVRAKYTYDKKNNCIDITQIPYTTTVEAVIDKIVDLIKQGKLKEVGDIRDETDLKGLKITIDLKRGVDADKLMAKLYKITPLMDSFGCNFNILINNVPKVLGIAGILDAWIDFRIGCIKRSIEYDIKKKSDRLHLLLGLEKILLDIDKAIRIIRETELEEQVVPNLMAGFDIDEIQAEYIADIKLRNINKEYILKRTQDIEDLMDEIATLKATLADEEKIKELIIKQLREISKKYSQPRRTDIIHADTVEEYVEEDNIEDYNIKIFLTKEGYLKKISHVSLRAASEQKLKEGDEITTVFDTVNKSEILVFTDKANVYKARSYEIADCKASQLGEYLPSLLDMEENEDVVGIAVTTDYEGYILFCYENGKMTKVNLNSYATKTNRKKLTKAYSSVSRLVKLIQLDEDMELVAISSIDKVLVFDTSKISVKATRDSQGVSVMTLRKSAVLTDVKRLEEVSVKDFKYYKTKNIPAAGCFLRDEDSKVVQTSMFG